jgi:MFS family permease
MVTGLTSMIAGPLLGRLVDAYGKFRVFSIGSIFAVILIEYYTHLGTTPLAIVIALNAVMFVAVSARIISANALTSAVPGASDRGAFMAITSSTQQLSGGVASLAAGLIVVQTPQGALDHYDVLGYVVGAVMIVTIFLMRRINRDISKQGVTK